jgi:hypothetical protein
MRWWFKYNITYERPVILWLQTEETNVNITFKIGMKLNQLESLTGKRPDTITIGKITSEIWARELHVYGMSYASQFYGIKIQISEFDPHHISVGYLI